MCLGGRSLLALAQEEARAHSTPILARGSSIHPHQAAVLGDSCAHLSLSLIQEDTSTFSTRPSSGRPHAHSLLSSAQSPCTLSRQHSSGRLLYTLTGSPAEGWCWSQIWVEGSLSLNKDLNLSSGDSLFSVAVTVPAILCSLVPRESESSGHARANQSLSPLT